MITKHLKTILYDSEFYYKLDNNPYKIAFQDSIYDLRENKFKDIVTPITLRKRFHLIIRHLMKNTRILSKM